MYFYMKFAAGGETFGDEWYRFRSMEDLPPCMKYDYPTRELEFRIPPLCRDFELVTIHLQSALDTMPPNERLHLNPARWSKVRRDLSDGWCYTPYMGLDEGEVALTDGRHRIVAMMKFLQLEYAPFSVPPEYVDAVRAQLKTR